jgi:hypothetical protein
MPVKASPVNEVVMLEGLMAQVLAHGPWPMARDPWPMAYGPWPMGHGPRPMAHGPHGPAWAAIINVHIFI